MAHSQINGLSSYPFTVDFFSDGRIIGIEGEFGPKGALTVVALLCAIYRNGYYARWEADLRYRLRREIDGVSFQFLEMVVRSLVKRGFFDKRLFDSDAILTSSEIQERYFGDGQSTAWHPSLPYLLFSCDDFQERDNTPLPAPEKDVSVPYIVDVDNININNNILDKKNITTTCACVRVCAREGEKEEKKIEGSENFIPATAKRNEIERAASTNSLISELKGSPQWQEAICMRNRISKEELNRWLDDYSLFCQSEDRHDSSLQEMKSHFSRWLPRVMDIQKDRSKSKTRNERRMEILQSAVDDLKRAETGEYDNQEIKKPF